MYCMFNVWLEACLILDLLGSACSIPYQSLQFIRIVLMSEEIPVLMLDDTNPRL